MSEQLQQPKTSDLENYRLLYNEFIGIVEQMQKTFSSLGNTIIRLGNEIDGLKQEVGYINQEIVGLNQEIDGLNQEIDGLNQEIDGLKQEVKELNQKNEGCGENTGDLKAALSHIQPEVSSLIPIQPELNSSVQKKPLKIGITYDATPGPSEIISALDPIATFLRSEFPKEGICADISLSGLATLAQIQKLNDFDLALFVTYKPNHDRNEHFPNISAIANFNPNLYWLFVDHIVGNQHPPISDLKKTWGSGVKGNIVFHLEKNSFSGKHVVCRRNCSKQNDNSVVYLKNILETLQRI